MTLKIINSTEKKKIIESLNEQFGISKLQFMLLRSGKDKIRAFSGSLSREEIVKLIANVRVEVIGLYCLREDKSGLRIAHDSVLLFKDQISKNLIEISDEEAEKWMKGKDVEIEDKEIRGNVVLSNKGDLIGSGKVKEGRISNYVPKERRDKK